jgi:4-diphosphocytidyl-2-C-methyl-D-erythritol kinase
MDDSPPDRTWPAPAKLNLFLHITGRRPDGYHLLQTVFQLLDYGDTLHFEITQDTRIRRRTGLPGVDESHDLTVRAARLLQSRCAVIAGVDIHLNKRLPMGGGLGGGSSDAATALVALNQLWRCGLSTQRLMSLGLELGADIPVFVQGRSAWAEGVGERLRTLELPRRWYLVVKPPVEVPTANVFAAPELTRNLLPITIRDFFSARGANVFEPVVRSRYSQVAEVLDWLDARGKQHSTRARLTGTGSCVFASFASLESAQLLLAEVPDDWQAFVAAGVNHSPLLKRRQEDIPVQQTD